MCQEFEGPSQAKCHFLSPLTSPGPSPIDTLGSLVCPSPSPPNNCCSRLPLAMDPEGSVSGELVPWPLGAGHCNPTLHPELPKPQQTKQATYWDVQVTYFLYSHLVYSGSWGSQHPQGLQWGRGQQDSGRRRSLAGLPTAHWGTAQRSGIW